MEKYSCVICNEEVQGDDQEPISQEGVQDLIKTSIKKNDNKHLEFKNCEKVIVHNSCIIVYVQSPNDQIEIEKLKKKTQEKIDLTPRRSQRFRSNQTFNLNQLCLFCEEDASDNFISKQENLSLEKRVTVFRVTKPETKNKLLDSIKTRSDKTSQKVYSRIHNVPDLAKAGARYHSHCFTRFYNYQELLDSVEPNHPLTSENSSILTFVINYILDHKEECQFSLMSIFKSYPFELNTFPTLEWLRDRLYEHFGNDIVCHSWQDDIFVCYRDIEDKVVSKDLLNKKKAIINSDEVRQRIIKDAANILFEDIRSQFYMPDNFTTTNYLLHNVNNEIPSNLKIFFDQLVKRNKKPDDPKWDHRVTALAHSTIASVRPRSFLSSLQIRLSSTLYKKFSSKNLINALSYLGLCASYEDTIKYESYILKDLRKTQLQDHFLTYWQGKEDKENGPTRAKKRKI